MNAELLNSIRRAIEGGDLKEVTELMEANPGAIKMKTAFGSWLHVAASKGQLEIVKLLVNRGLDVNARGGTANGNALDRAANNGHIDVVKYLLDVGSEMDVSEPERNPLFGAIFDDNVAMGKLLIDRGIDWKVKYTGGFMKAMDALEFAKERGAKNFIRFLESLQ